MQDTRRLTELQARILLREWQEELRLLDWNIQVHIKPQAEMKDAHGRVTVLEKKQCAYIRLLDPAEAMEPELESYCMETALVHELLHCSLAALVSKRSKRRSIGQERLIMAQEQTIHKTSVVLVKMKRELRVLLGQVKRRRAR